MTNYSKLPTYNLKVVLQETGIKPDTVRAWERRYGLPDPQRTAGRHRLYSERDIEMIKWFLARQDEGLSISKAVNLWKTLENDGHDPFAEYMPQTPTQPATIDFPVGAAVDEIRTSWIDACIAFDEPGAEATLTHAFALYPAEIACTEVLQKGLSQIGQYWYQGKISVQQEHFASSLALRKLNALIAASPPPVHAEKTIVACPPKEDHTFSALFIALSLRQRGWPVVYLGANVPLSELTETIADVAPKMIVLPAQQLHTAAALALVAREIVHQIPVIYGGLIFNSMPPIRQYVPGHFIGEELAHAPLQIEHLLTHTIPQSKALMPSVIYETASKHFQDQKAALSARIWEYAADLRIQRQYIEIANHQLVQDLEAALVLGDLSLLENELAWLNQLLTYHNAPQTVLAHYIKLFERSAKEILDQRGALIQDWLAEVQVHPILGIPGAS